uniref:Uncharacterized protein n=1 Tax=Noctiluca scintillans TaxID=2966 RepID=A0A7S1FBN8_NOCSC
MPLPVPWSMPFFPCGGLYPCFGRKPLPHSNMFNAQLTDGVALKVVGFDEKVHRLASALRDAKEQNGALHQKLEDLRVENARLRCRAVCQSGTAVQ